MLTAFLFLKERSHIVHHQKIRLKYQKKISHLKRETQLDVIHKSGEGPLQSSHLPLFIKPEDHSEQTQRIVQIFQKHSDSIEYHWKKYRIEVYERAGVKGLDLQNLDNVLSHYLSLIREIQVESSRTNIHSEEHEALLQAHNRVLNAMDEDVKEYLGADRFEYVKSTRANFNKAFQDFTHSSIEIIGW